jgi:hypothetical protein
MASRDLETLSRLVHAILADSDAIERIETLASYGQKHWEIYSLPDLGLRVCPAHDTSVVLQLAPRVLTVTIIPCLRWTDLSTQSFRQAGRSHLACLQFGLVAYRTHVGNLEEEVEREKIQKRGRAV